MNKQQFLKTLAASGYISLLFLFSFCNRKPGITYSISPSPWDESLGNHRAILKVNREAPAVYLDILWRRHDKNPQDRRFIIIHEGSGDTIKNIQRISVDRERCILAFGPVNTPGTYHFYYLPYKPDNQSGFYRFGYLDREPEPDGKWIQTNNLGDSLVVAGLPRVVCRELQARTAFDSFHPMEVIPTATEKEAFLSGYDVEYILFPESREFPIRMKDELPLKWLEEGVATSFEGVANRNEYYTFQIGVYAVRKDIENLQVEFSGLKGNSGVIGTSKITCFNTGGTDPYGKAFTQEVNVNQGRVQSLWIGIDLPGDIHPGKYRGAVTIRPANAGAQSIDIVLNIKDEYLADRGDGEPGKHTRLRWLNSKLGLDDQPVKRHHVIRSLGDMWYELNGKKIYIASKGFPGSILAGEVQILESPISFVVESEKGIIAYSEPEDVNLLKNESGIMAASWKNRSETIELTGTGAIESDGYLNYKIKVKALKDISLKDVRLEIPFTKDVAEYMMGMGLPGGEVPERHHVKWAGPHDSFWVGNTKGGLWVELRGSSYHGPLLNLYRPPHPESWSNSGKGGFAIKKNSKNSVATVTSGSRILKAGEDIEFEWSMLITPVREIDHKSQFIDRYYHNGHDPLPSEEELESGVKIINLHHGNDYNPYINYPFVAVTEMKDFVQDMHSKGQKVKIYYTIRELTALTSELWALRSLGFEILGNGQGGGYPWLQEHLVDGYRPQWYHPFKDKNHDASIVNAPGDSRWYNYYVEGLAWLVRNVDIDGLYLDDVTYDRRILKRMRKVLDQEKPGCLIDLHSNTGFSKGPATQYMEFFPYIDKIWFGESFRYNEMPYDNWLVEVSGIPFGHMGDMLHAGGNPWRGMVYGMTVRYPWYTEGVSCDPRAIWKIWDDFGIADAQMMGYWGDEPVVTTSDPDVKATVYIKADRLLVSVASWADSHVKVRLDFNWDRLGIDPVNVSLKAPAIEHFQPDREFSMSDSIPMEPTEGWLLYVDLSN